MSVRPNRLVHRRNAVTLLDVVLATAIIGTLAAVAVPSLSRQVDAVRGRSAIASLAADLRAVRSAARRTGGPVEVVFDLHARTYLCDAIHLRGELPNLAGWSMQCVTAPSIRFDAEGLAIDANGRPIFARISVGTSTPHSIRIDRATGSVKHGSNASF